MPTILVRNIIRILQEGKAYENKKDALVEVSFYGSVLGIDFQGMQMGSRKQKHAVRFTGSNVDEEHKENDKTDDHEKMPANSFLELGLEEFR